MVSPRDKAVQTIRLHGLGQRLRAARTRIGYTQEEAGERLGFKGKGQAGYQRWESGKVDVPISRLMDAADVFETSLSELLSIETPSLATAPVMNERSRQFLSASEQRLLRSFRAAPPALQAEVHIILGSH